MRVEWAGKGLDRRQLQHSSVARLPVTRPSPLCTVPALVCTAADPPTDIRGPVLPVS